ncbi:MAG: PD40 domain-containing protein, partial [Acidobacteria bacterium]|nr:PD40 domain-containing protein [Acidobacteriota bacterium]
MKKSNFVAFSFCLLLLLWASNAMGQRTSLISFNSAGTGSANNASGSNYATSPDGRFIAFASAASDLGPTDTNNLEDIYLRDTLTGATSLVSANYAGTNGGNNGSTTAISVSADGRYVLFSSNANDLVTNDT